MQNPSAEANQQEFQDEQLKLLDSISDERPENVLEAAKRIDLITDEIHKKIERDLPNHVLLFQRNFAKEASKGSPEEAFRRAFMSTYGKFLLEQKNETLQDPNGPLMGVLKKVLKFRIGDSGFQGRTELQAAAARLHILSSAGPAREDVQRRLAETQTKKAEKEQAAEELRPKVEALTNARDTVNSATDIDPLLSEVKKFQELKTNAQSRFNFLQADREQNLNRDQQEALKDLDPYVERIHNTVGLLNEVCNLCEVEFGLPEEKVAVIDQFIDEFEALIDDPNFNKAKLEEFLKTKYKPFLKTIKSRGFLKGSEDSEVRQVWGDQIFKDAVSHLDDSYKYFVKNLDKVENYEDILAVDAERIEMHGAISENQKQFEEKATAVIGKMESVNALKTPALEALIPGLSAQVDEFLRKLANLKPVSELTHEELSTFVENKFKPFITSVSRSVCNALQQRSGELGTLEGEIATIGYAIQKLQGYDGSIIEANIQKDIKKEEEKLAEAQGKQNEAQANFDAYNDLSTKLDSAKSPIADLEASITGSTRRTDLERQRGEVDGEIADLGTQIKAHVDSNAELEPIKHMELEEIVDLGDSDLETLRNKLDVVVLSRNVFGITRTTILTKESVDSTYNSLKAKYDPDRYKVGDQAREKATRQLRIIEECYAVLTQAVADGNVGPVPKNPIDELFRLKREYGKKQNKKKRLESQLRKAERDNTFEPGEVFGALDTFRDSVVEMRDTPGIDDALKVSCEGYLSAYPDLESHRADATPDAQLFVDFIQNKLNPFLEAFSAAVASKKLEAAQSLEATQTEVGTSSRRLEALKSSSPVDRILRKAFPGVKIEGGKVTIRGFETNFKHVSRKLEAAHEYFDSPDHVPNLRESATSLNNLLSGPEEGRPSPLLGLMDEVKDEAKIDPESGIHSQLNRLKQFIESKNRSLTTAPNETQLSKTLDNLQQRHRGTEPFDRKAERAKILEPYQTERNAQDDYISKLRELERTLTDILEQSKKLHEAMKVLIGHLNIVNKAGIKLAANGREINVEKVIKDFNEIDIRSGNFKPKQLLVVYDQIKDFFAEDSNIGGLLNDIYKAKEEVSKNINLTDVQAAKRIVSAIVAEQFPDMPLEEQQKLATLILAENVSTIQTLENYDTLAQRGSAELLNTVQAAAIKQKLIGMEFQVGDKTEHPFKGLKPENFSTPAEIEKLFASGRLNHQNGFLVLAAFEDIGGANCEQANYLRKRLKTALAEKLKVQDKMDEAGKNRIVDKAFEKSLKKARAAYKAYSDHFDVNKDTWNLYSVQELDTKFDKLEELHKLGMKDDIYYKRRAELLKEAREAGVEDKVKFAEDSALAGYWSSKESQWLRDRGHDIGKYAGRKALAVGKMGLGLTGRALWGATKVGAGLTYQLGIATPLRVGVKYPLMIAGKVAAFPFRMVNNFFRKTKWNTPFKLGQTVKADLAKTFNFFPETAGKVAAGAKASLKEVPKKAWGEAKWEGTEYKKRTKVDQKEMDERIKELGEKAKKTPVVLGESPYIDLAPFEKEIEQTDKMLAGGSAQGEQMKQAA